MVKSADAPSSKPQHPVEIAVIGGGPKAAAIAAKAWVLRNEKLADVHVTVFEPERIGAYWAGKSGYTDGEQRLCTIVERDVGYPYNSMFEESVDAAMSSKFSWARFLHSRPPGYEKGYSTWVDAGRKPPRHRHFADYLKWVMDEASPQVQVVKERVVRLTADGKRWQIETESRNGRATHSTRFDATVVTGPGPARRLREEVATGTTRPSSMLFNGQDFWQRLPEVRRFIKKAVRTSKHGDESDIVIIGAGGTAAAILSWLVSNAAQDLPIQMVANQASLYTRVDSVFENRLFSDETRWQTLSSNSRRAFFDRLNRGVVWETVMDNVSSASRFTMVDGRAQKIVFSSPTSFHLVVELGDGESVNIRPAMLIDCTGFDSWWFLEHISGFPLPDATREKKVKERWQGKMSENLQFQGAPWNKYPPLHAPMHSGELGPGFASLMVLGAMADRILRPHRF